MSQCDQSTFGGGFQSKKNRTSDKIDVPEMHYNVKDSDGKILESREYRVGQYVAIVNLKPGQELTMEFIKTREPKLNLVGPIQSFWTVLDDDDSSAVGAEIKRKNCRRRIPLRCLWPVEAPTKEERPPGEQENDRQSTD